MVAPVNLKLLAGAGGPGSSGPSAQLHGIGAQANCLQILCIIVQNNSTSSVPSVSSCASDNGLTWQRLIRTTNTVLSATSPGPTNNTTQVMEVWYAFGAVTNGGTFQFTLDRSCDGFNYHYGLWTGANATHPFDLGVNALLSVEHVANSDTIVTPSTDTSNVSLVSFFGRSANNNAGNPLFSSGAATDGVGAGNFGSVNNMRSYMYFKTSTSGIAAVNTGYSAALGNGPVTNFSGIAFAITADAQTVPQRKAQVMSIF